MKQEQRDKWAITRKKGRLKFVTLYDLIGWGLPMFAIMTFLIHRDYTKGLPDILFKLLVYSLAGILYGLSLWWYSEKKYNRHIEKPNH